MRKFNLLLLALIAIIQTSVAQTKLSGEYTISQNAAHNPDYTSFQAAIDDATTKGVQGIVTFKVMPGTFEEFLTITTINDLSAENQIIFKGIAPDNQQVVLTGNAGYLEKPIIKFSAVRYITFKNMKIVTTSSNYGNLVVFENKVNNLTFDSIYFHGIDVTANTFNNDKHIIFDNSKSADYTDSDLHFLNSQFVNGNMAFYLQGNNAITPPDSNLVIENCTFSNQYTKTIYATYQKNASIKNNKISNNEDIKNGFQAIDLFRVYENSEIENNIINIDFSTKDGTGIEVRPAIGTATEPVIIRNNMVKITSNSNLNYAFKLSNSSSENVILANNTALMQGTGSGAVVYIDAVIPNFKMYNNLFVSENSGYIIRHQKTDISNFTSNYNRCLFNGNYYGRIGSNEYATLQEWQTASGNDNNTEIISTNPFISNTNLHISNSTNLTVANPLSYVTHDIDNELRSTTTPCAGADEIVSGGNLPPYVANPISDVVFENANDSTIISLNNTFADPDDPDEDIVISIASNSNPQLVEATLLAGNRDLKVKRISPDAGTSTIVLSANSNGQTVETSFNVICNVPAVAPVIANQVDPVNFTTYPETKTINLTNAFAVPGNPNANMQLTIQSSTNTHVQSSLSANILTLQRINPTAFTNHEVVIRCTYNSLFVDMTILMSGTEATAAHGTATFEDITLSSNGTWTPPHTGENAMISDTWSFYNYYHSSYWGGFTASNRTDTTLSGMAAQYTAIAGEGVNESEQYAVGFTMGYPADVKPADNDPDVVSGCYVTNNLWTYRAILEGDGYGPAFGGNSGNDPDYFRVWAVGKRENNTYTDTLYYYLADYRSPNNSEDYVVNTWEWFDLSTMGIIKSIRFGLQSSRSNAWGMTTPAYFCMDDFNGIPPTTPNQPPYVANSIDDVLFTTYPCYDTLDLTNTFADPDDPSDSIVLSVGGNTNPQLVQATINEKTLYLERLSSENDTVLITINAESNGQYANTSFNVFCTDPQNLPPYVLNPIPDVTFEYYPDYDTLDLSNTFADPDDPSDSIVLSVTNNTNPELVQTILEDKTLYLERLSAEVGDVVITINANSAGQEVATVFTVHCLPIPNPEPYLANPIEHIYIYDYPFDTTFSLIGTVSDPDVCDSLIVYTVINNSSPNDIEAVIDNNSDMTITRLNPNHAEVVVTVRATSNDQFIDFDIDITNVLYENVYSCDNSTAIYPNPTSDYIKIESSKEFSGYMILNSNGNIIKNSVLDNKIIDVSNLMPGNYILILIENNKKHTIYKFIKI